MKVAMYHSGSDIRIEEMPIPEIDSGELLVKIVASGICGSDLMEWYRIKKAPLVLGHEITGVVEKIGAGVSGFKKGDRVVVTHHVPCEACSYCTEGNETVCETLRSTNFFPGGFSEYVRIPKINVDKGTFLLPPEISYEEGTFIEPLGCVVRGQRVLGIKKTHTVLVLGSGISGLLHIQLAKKRGVRTVIATDIKDHRLEAAKRFGADAVLNAESNVSSGLRRNNQDRLADRVIVCTGSVSAIKQALASVEPGGVVLFFAPTDQGVEVPIHVDELWKNGITLTTSYGAVKRDLLEAIDLIRKKTVNVRDMISHRMSLSEAGKGFLIFSKGESLKVVIKPHGV